jgi:hypothetical protein
VSAYYSVCIEGGYPIVRPHATAEEQKAYVRQRIAEMADAFWLDVDAQGKPHMGRVTRSEHDHRPLWLEPLPVREAAL